MSVVVNKIELNISDYALDLHEGRPVGPMKRPPFSTHQVLDVTTDQLVPAVANPAAEGEVDLCDLAIFRGKQQTTISFIEENFRTGLRIVICVHLYSLTNGADI